MEIPDAFVEHALGMTHRDHVVPGARFELLPGVGHTPMMEDPETTGKLLLDFAYRR